MVLPDIASQVQAQTVTFFETGEEFAGPFPRWKNFKVIEVPLATRTHGCCARGCHARFSRFAGGHQWENVLISGKKKN